MSEKWAPLEGETQKKRVVCLALGPISASIMPLTLRSNLSMQCYFFDSDIGGFHYGPGHPYDPLSAIQVSRVLMSCQNEAHTHKNVSLAGHELWFV